MDTVELGAFAPSIQEQFPELPVDLAKAFEADRLAILRLYVRDWLTQSQTDAARKKLARSIFAASNVAKAGPR